MRRIRVLCYHRVEDISTDFNMLAVKPQNFRKQMEYLKENYDILRLDDINENIENEGSRDAVVITFDDGYYDLLSHAYPILERYEIPATMFIATGNIGTGRENWTDSIIRALFDYTVYHESFELEDDFISGQWYTRSIQERLDLYTVLREIFRHISGEKKHDYEKKLLAWADLSLEKGRNDRRMLSVKELKILSQKPLITIGAHSVTHPSLKWISLEEQKYELFESKKVLERITGQEINLFAYPFGTKDDYTEQTIDLLKECGYKKAVTVQKRGIDSQTPNYEIPRYCVRNNDVAEFGSYVKNVVFGEETATKEERKERMAGISYIGKLEADRTLLEGKQKIIIWGCGYRGTEMYEYLKLHQMSDRIIAFGDNDCKKAGTVWNNILVMGINEVIQLIKKQSTIILVKGKYAWEICDELIEKSICNIHLIVRS